MAAVTDAASRLPRIRNAGRRPHRGWRFLIAELKAGTVWVNTHNILDITPPTGGNETSTRGEAT